MNFSFLRKLRTSHGMSGAELSRRAEVSQPTISIIENNANQPSVPTMDKIAGVFSLSSATMFAAATKKSECSKQEYKRVVKPARKLIKNSIAQGAAANS